MKTLLVGFDGVCWDYLEPLLRAGRLPTIQGLIQAGSRGTLRSTLPAWTPTAWASISTGKNPGKHGVFDMLWRYPGSYDFLPTNAQHRVGTPFWKRLNDTGFRVGLVNIPFTHPTESLDGFVVHGFGTPNSVPDLTYPGELLDWIIERYGTYEPAPMKSDKDTPSQVLARDREEQVRQVDMAVSLARRHPVDILVINLMHFDHANHNAADLGRVYDDICETDKDLRTLIDGFQPTNTMLISDHGSRRIKGGFRLNVWLRDHGYCFPFRRTSRERRDALNWALVLYARARLERRGLTEKVVRHLAAGLSSRMPASMLAPLWGRLGQVLPDPQDYVALSEQVDFGTSRVFPGSGHSGILYLNLTGREPNGMVSSQDKQPLLTELTDQLLTVTDPVTAKPVFSSIHRPEDIYDGPLVDFAPDLILDSYDSDYGSMEVSHSFHDGAVARDRYFIENYRWFGDHARDGVFVFSGDAFREATPRHTARLVDVPATLLHLHGVPIPEDYDGHVLQEVLHEDSSGRSVRFQPGDPPCHPSSCGSYNSKESQEVLDRLRGLGYL